MCIRDSDHFVSPSENVGTCPSPISGFLARSKLYILLMRPMAPRLRHSAFRTSAGSCLAERGCWHVLLHSQQRVILLRRVACYFGMDVYALTLGCCRGLVQIRKTLNNTIHNLQTNVCTSLADSYIFSQATSAGENEARSYMGWARVFGCTRNRS